MAILFYILSLGELVPLLSLISFYCLIFISFRFLNIVLLLYARFLWRLCEFRVPSINELGSSWFKTLIILEESLTNLKFQVFLSVFVRFLSNSDSLDCLFVLCLLPVVLSSEENNFFPWLGQHWHQFFLGVVIEISGIQLPFVIVYVLQWRVLSVTTFDIGYLIYELSLNNGELQYLLLGFLLMGVPLMELSSASLVNSCALWT